MILIVNTYFRIYYGYGDVKYIFDLSIFIDIILLHIRKAGIRKVLDRKEF